MAREHGDAVLRFDRHFGTWTDRPLLLYGVGPSTGHIVEHFRKHTFIGLLDPSEVGATRYGLPVLALSEALDRHPAAIIIVARPASVNTIYRRIAQACSEKNIPVLDLGGRNLQARGGEEFSSPEGLSYAAAADAVAAADSVSFDVFDTLLTRTVVEPTDVFQIAAERFMDSSRAALFKAARIRAERAASTTHPAHLGAIYAELASTAQWSPSLLAQLEREELAVETEVLRPRPGVIALLNHAAALGKPVTAISDMYLPSTFIRGQLTRFGAADVPVLVSCEEGLTKPTGLLRRYAAKASGSLLHIGDSLEADIVPAERLGMATLHLPSPLAVAESSPAERVLSSGDGSKPRIQAGLAITRLFADPFKRHPLTVDTATDLGYLIIGPLVDLFLHWCAANRPAGAPLLFSARDGHLLNRAVHETPPARGRPPLDPTGVHYFLTSRTVAQLAQLRTADDIRHLAEHPFSGTSEELLRIRFDLPDERITPQLPGEAPIDHVIRHRDHILARAEETRENYLTYLHHLFPEGVPSESTFVDFVAAGTAQAGVEDALGLTLRGLYFVRIPCQDERRAALAIHSLYPQRSAFSTDSNLFALYTFLEAFFSSPHPTLRGFTAEGGPIYAREDRSPGHLRLLDQVHEGALSYLSDLWRTASPPSEPPQPRPDDDLPETLLSLLRSGAVRIAPELLKLIRVTDDFCNRPYSGEDALGAPQ